MPKMTKITKDAFDKESAVTRRDGREADPPQRGKRGARTKAALTSRQKLTATIKKVRNKLRKDAGLSGDTDRLPQLTWMLFLKAFDDFEYARQEEEGHTFEPVIELPYRWRDWAAVPDQTQRLKGDELIEFVNNKLFPYLANLSGLDENDIRSKVGKIFQGTYNRVRSGYILREVVDIISTLNFNASDDIHTVSLFYETMLREMRDAAGDAGEFYTPRPVVRFIIDRLNPRLGERLLDPACGTGGFLVEAYERLKGEARTPQQLRELQQSLMGIEKKPMPYLLGMMNLLLHGIENPNIVERNALTTNIRHIRPAERVEAVATNPPFGGEEEKGIQGNFPEDRQTAETALLFLQLIMRKLKRQPTGVGRPARAAVVVPNGTLFGDGVCARIKEELLKEFNLHTVVRLPNGVFAPYTSIPTNILFFDRSGPTKEVWYYEQPLPEGRKNYTKTQPLQFDEFKDCIAWWGKRKESDQAWRVPVKELLEANCNLDRKNPRGKVDFEHLPPDQLADDILKKELRIAELMREIKAALGAGG